jgi:hemolysin-activating ACP:hemolysin acyltransferase
MPLAFAVWARVDDKTLDKILHEDYKIAADEWNNVIKKRPFDNNLHLYL